MNILNLNVRFQKHGRKSEKVDWWKIFQTHETYFDLKTLNIKVKHI